MGVASFMHNISPANMDKDWDLRSETWRNMFDSPLANRELVKLKIWQWTCSVEELFWPPETGEPFVGRWWQEFWKSLSGSDEVHYLSRQNDSLREEFPALLEDVPSILPLAKDVCGNEPEAVNLWIGPSKIKSSQTKSSENCVVGECAP